MRKQKKVKRLFLWLVLLFAIAFFARWFYEVYFSGHDVTVQWDAYRGVSYESASKANIATDSFLKKDSAGREVQIDQKYDKTANMAMASENFEETNRAIRVLAEGYHAVIQMENLTGLEGARRLTMTIGVAPDAFDALVDAVRAQASLMSFTVNKVDKTDEYRKLMAEIGTLEKTRDAYRALQAQGGSLQDQLTLQEKLLEVERSLQSIGASAGLYASENSFCTVHLSVTETEPQGHTFSLARILRNAKSSFLWTASAFAVGVFILFGLCAVAAASVWFVNWMRGGFGAELDKVKKGMGEKKTIEGDGGAESE